jgi:peptidoglycan/LPS O-acetylase OafA/YrhL
MGMLQVAVVFSLASAVLAEIFDCSKALNNTPKPVLAEMVLATGKDLPFDSGKYSVCKNIEVQSAGAIQTKFFIVRFDKPTLSELGMCLPAACGDKDIDVLQKFLVEQANMTSLSIFHIMQQDMNPFNVKDDRLAWGKGTSISVAVVAALVALVLISTALVNSALRRQRSATISHETSASSPSSATNSLQPPVSFGAQITERTSERALLQQQSNVRLPKRLWLAEAFALNGPKGTWTALWTLEKSRPTDCLNGFRVLSMFFIVMGHGLLEPMNVLGYHNAECIVKNDLCLDAASTNVWSYILLAGQLGVDTFFFISGFLLSFVGKGRKMPIVLGTALRFARLLPLFGFVQMVYILISPYLAFGPFSPRFQNEVFTACSNNSWWSELLFISAFYPWEPDQGGCMGWSWYLGIDMVFAILGLILLNVWKRQRAVGWAVSLILFFGCIAVTIQQSLYYKLEYDVLNQKKFGLYGVKLYSRPYARFPGFLVGLVAPWALDALETRGLRRGTEPRSLVAKIFVYSCCLLAVAIAAVCIFLPAMNSAGPGPSDSARQEGTWSLWFNALWIGLTRPIWCLCWLTLSLPATLITCHSSMQSSLIGSGVRWHP